MNSVDKSDKCDGKLRGISPPLGVHFDFEGYKAHADSEQDNIDRNTKDPSPEKEYKWELFFALIIMYALYFWFLYWFKETTGEPFLGNQ